MVPKGVNWLTISREKIGSFLTNGLSVVELLSLDRLLAMMALHKFTGKKIRDNILRSFDIFNIKIKNTQNSLPSGKNLF